MIPLPPVPPQALGTTSLQIARVETMAPRLAPSRSLDALLEAVPPAAGTSMSLASSGLPSAPDVPDPGPNPNTQGETPRSDCDWKTIFVTCEIKSKIEQAQEGVAREWCYLNNAFQACGAFIGLVIIRFRLAVCLMLDEGTIVMETNDESSWGRVDKLAEVSAK